MKSLFFIAIVIAACNNHTSTQIAQKDSTETDTVTTLKESFPEGININTFKKLPPEIEGCSGLFYLDSNELNGEKYVFVTNLQGKAFMMIENSLTEFTLQTKDNSEGVINEKYSSENYKIDLSLKMEKRIGDEVWLYIGTVRVYNDSTSAIKKIRGEIGC